MMLYCSEHKRDTRHKWDDFLNRFVCLLCLKNGKPGYDKPVMYPNYNFLKH